MDPKRLENGNVHSARLFQQPELNTRTSRGPCASEPSAVTHLGTKDSGRHPAHGFTPKADRILIYTDFPDWFLYQ